MSHGDAASLGSSWADAAAWGVTYAGPQASWRTSSFSVGLRFIASLEEDVQALRIAPDVDLRPDAVVVQLRDQQDPEALRFALHTQQRAEDLGLEADTNRIQTISLSVAHAHGVDVQSFWAAALGYETVGDRAVNDPLRRGPFVAFQHLDRVGRGRLHVDVSVPADRAEARVEAALAAGGRLAIDREAPDWWGLASPDNHSVDIVAWPDRASPD